MSYRAWTLVVAFGLALSSSLQAQDQQRSGNERIGEERSEPEPPPVGFPVRIVESPEASRARERRESESAQREKDDLAAQQGVDAATQKINDATQSMKLAAWVPACFAATGTFLIAYATILSTRATEAAIGATAILRQEQRPWIKFSRDKTCDFEDYGHGGKLQMTWQVENVGKSPAFRVRVDYRLWKDDSLFGPGEFLPDFMENCKVRSKERDRFPWPIVYPGPAGKIIKKIDGSGGTHINGGSSQENGRIRKRLVEGKYKGLFVIITYFLNHARDAPLFWESCVLIFQENKALGDRRYLVLDSPNGVDMEKEQ